MSGNNIPIAVLGMGCRFPGGADDPEKLWSMLSSGNHGGRTVPRNRWNWESFYHPDPATKEALNWKHGYFLGIGSEDDGENHMSSLLSAFDSRFFDIAPREAAAVDPQQRLLLETVYEALEQAGLTIDQMRGSNTSVHMATFARDYDRMGYQDGSQLPHLHLTGTGDAIMSARISYWLDLQGPCHTLDTGCSGSMVAVHEACEALRTGQATMAIAGGSQLLLSPDQSIALSCIGIANKDGKCYVFDDRGQGYGRGEGVAALVLKRLDDAIWDGDPIQGVVVGSGVNHDGRTKGIYLPNAEAQEALSRSVYARAGLDPTSTLYVEAHGTGTEVGDAAEVQSISRVFGREAGRAEDFKLRIGSIKANIGHLESVSGASGLIKALMVLKKNQIPPQLNFVNPKPSLRLDERKIEVPVKLTQLAPDGYVGPKRVSVNSFGYGGTNASVILEAYNETGDEHLDSEILSSPTPDAHFVMLSANSESSLRQTMARLQEWLLSPANSNSCTQSFFLQDLSHTLCNRRSILPWRFSVVANSTPQLVDLLAESLHHGTFTKVNKTTKQDKAVSMSFPLAFIFTGQGSQWFAMGRELLLLDRATATASGSKSSPPNVFCATIMRFNDILHSETVNRLGHKCDWDLEEELLRDADSSRLGEACIAQPATTAVQLALVDLLASWGIQPHAVCGHSSGEIAAAYAAGNLSLEGAALVSYLRGVVSSSPKARGEGGGAMLAVGEGEEEVTRRIRALGIERKVVVACVNSPQSTTLSGDVDAVDKLACHLEDEQVFNRRLKVDAAYHSHHMSAVAKDYLSLLSKIELSDVKLQSHAKTEDKNDVVFISSVTAKHKLDGFGPEYWVENLESQVKFSAAVQLVSAELRNKSTAVGSSILIEIGPHSALMGPVRQCLSRESTGSDVKYSYLSCLTRGNDALQTSLGLASRMFNAGWPVALKSVLASTNKGRQRRPRVITTLPTYAWDHSPLPGTNKAQLWTESRISKSHRLRQFPYHDLLGLLDVASAPLHEPRWRFHVSVQTLPWLADHVVDGFIVFPGAGYLTMAIEAAKQLFWMRFGTDNKTRIKNIRFKDVAFVKPVIISGENADGSYPEVELMLCLTRDRQYHGNGGSNNDNGWDHYRILSYNPQPELSSADNDAWTEHSSGLVSIESETTDQQQAIDEVEGVRERHLTEAAGLAALTRAQTLSTEEMVSEQFYADLEASGNSFGPTFQGVRSIWLGKCVGVSKVVVPDVSELVTKIGRPRYYMQPHTIHPSALDAVTQLQAQLFRRECSPAPVMPVSIAELSIVADWLDARPGSELTIALELTPEGKGKQAEGSKAAMGRLWAFQKAPNSPDEMRAVITSSGMNLRAIGEAKAVHSSESEGQDRKQPFNRLTANNSRLEWKQDVDTITQDDFHSTIAKLGLFDVGHDTQCSSTTTTMTASEKIALGDKVATLFVLRALRQLRAREGGIAALRKNSAALLLRPHLHKLLDWMVAVEGIQNDSDAHIQCGSEEEEQRYIQKAAADNAIGQALTLIGPRLANILTDPAEDALKMLLADGLLERIYADHMSASPYAQAAAYLALLAHKRPNMRVLEIGAGTGGATMPLMECLDMNARSGSASGRLLLESYTFTDISAGFFERAREKLSRWTEHEQLLFKTLDVGHDPVKQGLELGNYDLIIASNVLHATPSIDATLANVRRLLKPGTGRLLIIEATRLTAAINVIFGNLEGWWMYTGVGGDKVDEERKGAHSPLLSVTQWDTVLKRNDFSGADLAVPDHIGDAAFIHFMVSRAVPSTANSVSGHQGHKAVSILQSRACEDPIVSQIQASLGKRGIEEVQTFSSSALELNESGGIDGINTESVCIIVDSSEPGSDGCGYLLEEAMSSAILFSNIKRLLTQTRNLVWVSVYDSESDAPPPASTMIVGMARVIRRENPGLRLITVHAQRDTFTASTGHGALAEICLSSFWPTSTTEQAEEWEYMVSIISSAQSPQIMIPRLVPDTKFADFVESVKPEWAMLETKSAEIKNDNGDNNGDDEDADLVETQYLDSARPLQLEVHTPGLLSSLRFVDNPSGLLDLEHSPLGPDEIHIEALAYGINFKDVLIALGQLPPGIAMASEVCGRVTAVGSNMASLFSIGDRVVGAFAAPFASYARVSNGNGYYVVPDSISSTDAASIPLIFYTAWYCLVSVARLSKGQSILIHAASGGVGQAAIQFAQLIGAGDIFVTVGSSAKKRLVQERYGIPDGHIFSSHPGRSGFKQGVLRLTGGKGVDVVLNSLSGEMLADSWECIAAFGTFVEIGKTDILRGSRLSMAPFEKQVTFASVDLTHIYHAKPEATRKGMAEILDFFDRKVLKPVYPVNVYPMSKIHDAFRLMAARKHVGKQVLVVDPSTIVKASRPITRQNPNAITTVPKGRLELDRQGAYIIGGGLGDLGRRIALFLAAHGAGHIVTLSRSTLDPSDTSLQEDIQKFGANLYTLQCDLGDESSVTQVGLTLSKLGHPIRGVINAGLVLRDSMLEFMTHEDYTTALRPKYAGTMHLQRLCDPDSTDFFITLSSVTTIVGLASQSNYCAGNAFQDAFAYDYAARKSSKRTRHISINVGAVQGSRQVINAKGLTPETGLMVSFDEFFTTLEYAMGPRACVDGAVQCIMRISVEPWTHFGSSSSGGLPNHMFDILASLNRYNRHREQKNPTLKDTQASKKGVGHAATQASSVAEAENIVATATAAKFAAFVGQEVGLNESVAALGLDSLVTIELKNWVVHTFKVRLQAVELTSAGSIIALAALIVSRMDLEFRRDTGPGQKTTESQTSSPPVSGTKGTVSTKVLPKEKEQQPLEHSPPSAATHGFDCCKYSPTLPVKPRPDLDDALDYWIETSSHLWKDYPDEWAAILNDIKTIRSPQSPARLGLEEKILKSYGDGAHFNDTLTRAFWLSRRHLISAVNTHTNISGHSHTQAERAALITRAVVDFRRGMEKMSMNHGESSSGIEPLWIAGRPICTWAWRYLFNSVREPRHGTDEIVRYTHGADHIVALRKGRVFKIDTLGDDGVTPVSFETLRDTFDAIIAYVPDADDMQEAEVEAVWTGMLTTDNRDSWADVRRKLISNSGNGAEYISTIESAVTVISLDSCSPQTPQERARQVHHRNGLNRWFDKPLQFCIGTNGTSCVVVEHSGLDGLDLTPLWGRIASAIKTFKPSTQPKITSGSAPKISLNEIVLTPDPETAQQIAALKASLLQSSGPDLRGLQMPYAQAIIPELGTKFLLSQRAPVKAVIDVTFLLAVRLLLGHCVAATTPVGVAHFHRSRVDIVLTMNPAVKAFCNAAAATYGETNDGVVKLSAQDQASLDSLLRAAAAQVTASVQAALAGRSHIRVFELVGWLWKQQHQEGPEMPPVPRFLEDKLFRGRQGDPYVNGQTMGFEADLGADNFLYLDPDPNLFWACLIPHEDDVSASICGGSEERTANFVKCLHQAANIVRSILEPPETKLKD